MSNAQNIVNGFAFASAREAVQAAKEAEGIRYIRGKTNMENPYVVLQIYNRMISENLFETVVGYSFLKELQNILYESPVIADEDILPIAVQHRADPVQAHVPMHPVDTINPSFAADFSETVNASDRTPGEQLKQLEEKTKKLSKKVTENTRQRDKIANINYKQRFQTLSVVCAVLAVCVIAMFVLTATGRSTTILNYENQVIDKYEAWEQELRQREAAVEEREKQFGQD